MERSEKERLKDAVAAAKDAVAAAHEAIVHARRAMDAVDDHLSDELDCAAQSQTTKCE